MRIKYELAEYLSRNNFSEVSATEAFQHMAVQLDRTMRSASVPKDLSLRHYQQEYECVLGTLSDGLEARLIDGDRWYKDSQ